MPRIIEISKKSKHFMFCRVKHPDCEEKDYCVEEYLDCWKFIYKPKVPMMRELGAENSGINTPILLANSNEMMNKDITSKVINSIIDMINSRHMPRIYSESSKRAYITLFQNYLQTKIMSFADIMNNRFVLIIQK